MVWDGNTRTDAVADDYTVISSSLPTSARHRFFLILGIMSGAAERVRADGVHVRRRFAWSVLNAWLVAHSQVDASPPT